MADLHIFPVKHIPEDPEGFGMVAIEAAAHGTPTIAFATGGIVDAVKQNSTGFLIQNADYDAFSARTIELLQQKIIIPATDCQEYAEQFAWSHLVEQFNPLIKSLDQ